MSIFYKLLEVSADMHFSDDDGKETKNWAYCRDYATFPHREACEFIIHIPEDADSFEYIVDDMREKGCSEAFIEEYRRAKRQHADYVLFYA